MVKTVKSLLVIGLDVAALAQSARRAGYIVYSVDYFGDEDLKQTCQDNASIILQKRNRPCGRLSEKYDPKLLLKMAKALSRKHSIDGAVLSSGLEDAPEILEELNDHIPIIGNPPATIKRVRDKTGFFQELDRLKIAHPITEIAESQEEACKKAKDIGYPVIVKPMRGFGGMNVTKISNRQMLEQTFRSASSRDKEILVQEYIQGIPASASAISIPERSVTLTVNEQLLGLQAAGQRAPFGYCGNIVPLSTSRAVTEKCEHIVETVTTHFGLRGSNGVDIVLSNEAPQVIEVNPRFQGTLACVEKVSGIDVLNAHIEACVSQTLPKKPLLRGFCTRLILFAKKRSKIPDLTESKGIIDIPFPETIIEKDEPICSVITKDCSRKSSLDKAEKIAESIYARIASFTAH